MDESSNAENKKQTRQKPPLSAKRITGETLAGLALGLVVLLAVYVTGIVLFQEREGEAAVLPFLAMFLYVVPPLNGLGSAVGVYLVGRRGNETGSFMLTLRGGFLLACLLPFALLICSFGPREMTAGEKMVRLAGFALVLPIPPIAATLCFNLTRRYKQPPLS